MTTTLAYPGSADLSAGGPTMDKENQSVMCVLN
jgi:hypothetical protein